MTIYHFSVDVILSLQRTIFFFSTVAWLLMMFAWVNKFLVVWNVKRQYHRNIIWFNPPYSREVITNVANKFLQLTDLHFPPSKKFHKIFNRNNMKVSYCCTQNVGNIKSHNKKLINSSSHATVEKKNIALWRGNAELKT